MGLLHGITADKRKLMGAMLLVFLLAAFVRFHNIQWSFSDNGVDEGIMLMRARMMGEGFELYKDIPCDQAPLAFFPSAAFGGDVLASRLLSAVLSIAAIAACMEAAKRVRGETAMLATGLILAVDFAFLRESRLFSLDGMSSYFLAFSLLPLLIYVKGGGRRMLALAAVLMGLSAASKLYGAIAVVGVLAFMVLEMVTERRRGTACANRVADAAVFLVAAVTPIGILLLLLGPSEMVQGMLFDQGHRDLDLVMKLSIPLYFAFNVAYALPLVRVRALWAESMEARMLLCISLVLLANFVFQPLAFLHNLVLMSPPLAVLVGIVIAGTVESKKVGLNREKSQRYSKRGMSSLSAIAVLFVVSVVVSAGFASYGLAVQGRSGQEVYGEAIAAWTSPDDYIISGDPLIAAYAERKVPPGMINMGMRIYPDITLQDVQDAVQEYDAQVVVICYRLFEDDMNGLVSYLRGQGFSMVPSDFIGPWSKAAIDGYANDGEPWVLVSQEIVDRLDLPVLDWEDWLSQPA